METSDRIKRRRAAQRVREDARPLRLRRTLGGLARIAWWRVRRRWTAAWVAYVVVLVLQITLGLFRSAWYDAATIGYLLSGSVALTVAAVAEADLESRRSKWRLATSPSVGGHRIVEGFAAVDPESLLLVDLLAWLHSESRLVRRPIRGHPHGGSRTTLAVGLRDLSRGWAAARGFPLRRGDALARRLLAIGVIRAVPVGQATAWRLVYGNLDDGLRALEEGLGAALIDWATGRDPTEQG